MYEITLHTLLHRINAVYHLFGLWQNQEESPVRKVGKKLFHMIFMLSFGVAFGTGACSTDNKIEFIFLTAGTVVMFVAFVRLSFILSKKKEISAFLDDIGVHSFTDQQEFIEMKNKWAYFTYISYVMSLIFITVLCCPLISAFSSEKKLPFNIGFPLNWRDSEVAYWIAFVYVEWGLFVAVLTQLYVVQLWYLMINYSMKYEMLGNKFKSLGSTETTIKYVQITKISKVPRAQKQTLFLQDFIKLIKIHQHIRETVQKFRECFAYSFFAQITTSAIDICGLIYVLASSTYENWFEILFFPFTLICSLFDVFMVMYFGNEIKLSSNQLSYCLFQSNWIEQSEKCKKCIIILAEVFQQPQELVIFKLYSLDLETFTRIINLAYSMFHILQRMN